MIYLRLFLTFLKIGAVSFGGGYGMISLIREECLSAGWLTEDELMNFIAVSESTPGPIAVNMATFIGSAQAGALGSALCTFGVVLPSFIIILLVAAVLKSVLKYAGVRATLESVRPAIVGLILATAAVMALSALFGFGHTGDPFTFEPRRLALFIGLGAMMLGWKKLFGKPMSPILLILTAGAAGVILF